jgi:positive regulator of sigma E activity
MRKHAEEFTLEAPPGLGVGARVAFVLPEASVSRLALLGYGFPVLFALLGASLGQGVFGGDGAAALFALGAFVLALFLVRPLGRRLFRAADGARGGALVSLSPLSATASGQRETGDRLSGRAV